MEKEFIPYEQALALKELGFNEPCFARYEYIRNELQFPFCNTKNHNQKTGNGINYQFISAPLYQQAFSWFREKYDLHLLPSKNVNKWWATFGSWTSEVYDSYEEAELACLKKLIEIVKNK